MKSFLNNIGILFSKYFELTFWILALTSMAIMSPTNDHSSFCPINSVGLGFCPGCGLGHSISWLFHGNIGASIDAHPVGWFAVLIILYRIITLVRNLFFTQRISLQ
jgi:hypothetical protein